MIDIVRFLVMTHFYKLTKYSVCGTSIFSGIYLLCLTAALRLGRCCHSAVRTSAKTANVVL